MLELLGLIAYTAMVSILSIGIWTENHKKDFKDYKN